MSDHIPFEIQIEIIKRLPVKSLIRFRSVSKLWKSLIGSSEFIADSSVHHSQPQRLLVSYKDPTNYEVKCVLIDDDDSFPQRKCSLYVPTFIKLIKKPSVVGSSHGLLCLSGYYYLEGYLRFPDRVVGLWNPSIQKSVVIKVPNVLDYPYKTVFGFGVCPNTNDPKIVKINCTRRIAKLKDISSIPWKVEVFTLSSGAWRIPSGNLPRKSIYFDWHQTIIDGFIYWLANDMTFLDDHFNHLIISFDLKSENFSEIYLPDYLSHKPLGYLWISKLRDSLVVLEESRIGLRHVYGLWMMDHGVPNSFRKLFTIGTPMDQFLGFRENVEALLQTINWDKGSAAVEVYEPSSKHIKDLGIYGRLSSLFVSSFMESLILLDQPSSLLL